MSTKPVVSVVMLLAAMRQISVVPCRSTAVDWQILNFDCVYGVAGLPLVAHAARVAKMKSRTVTHEAANSLSLLALHVHPGVRSVDDLLRKPALV